MNDVTCDFCGDPIEDQPIKRGSRVYCCEACAFEASRSADCGGRTDSNIPQSVTEAVDREVSAFAAGRSSADAAPQEEV